MTRLCVRVVTLALAFILALPTSGSALSCARPDVRRAYQTAAASSETYVVVLGSLDFNPSHLPAAPPKTAQGTLIPARLSGRNVSRSGYSGWFTRQITLNVTCISAWCGNLPAHTELLMFLRKTDRGMTLDVTPCPETLFVRPRASDLSHLRKCMSDGACKP